MFKWIWLIFFLVFGGLSIASALDDSGSSLADLFIYAILAVHRPPGVFTALASVRKEDPGTFKTDMR
jgi:hypothetical protein